MRVKVLSLLGMGVLLAACSDETPKQAEVVFTPEGQFNAPGSVADFKATGDRVHFGFDKSSIEDLAVAEQMAKWLSQYKKTVDIVGHCDERGTLGYNDLLGQRRANALKSKLAALGCSHLISGVYSAGKRYPIVAGTDEGAYAQNRVAIAVLKEAGCASGPTASTAMPTVPVPAEADAAVPVDAAMSPSDEALSVPEM